MDHKYDEAYYQVHSRIPIIQDRDEILTAMDMIADYIPTPTTVLEIGSYYGGSAALLGLLTGQSGVVVSIDPQLQVSLMVDEVTEILAPRKFMHIPGYSQDAGTIEEVHTVLASRTIDVLMIDGDHNVEPTMQDYEMYAPLVGAPGVILLHDINDQYELGPRMLVDKLGDVREIYSSPVRLGIGIILQ